MRLKAMIIGAGALGLGFLAERLAADYDLCLVDQRAKADLLGNLSRWQGFTVNLCGAQGIRSERRAGSFRVAFAGDPHGDVLLNDMLAQADLVLTATSRSLLDNVVRVIAPGLNARSRKVWILFCENGLNIAESYKTRFGSHVRLVDTVMSRMCRFDKPSSSVYQPLWPGHDISLIVEEFDFLPLDASQCSGGPFSEFATMVSPNQFRLWEDIKLYMHNGMHAYVSYHAYLAGAQCFPDTPAAIRDAAQAVMLSEVIPAIARSHACASREELEHYGLSLLARFFNAFFNDSIERGVRGVEEKLAPGERLLGGCEYIRRAGIEPIGYATTIEAAKAILARRGILLGDQTTR